MLDVRTKKEPWWTKGRRRRDHTSIAPVPLEKAMSAGNLLVLEFLLDGKAVAGTKHWSLCPPLVAPAVTECLRQLTRSGEVVVVNVRPASPTRHTKSRSLRTSADEIFLSHALAGHFPNFAFIHSRDSNSIHNQIIAQVPSKWLAPVVQLGFESNSFRAYITRPSKVDALLAILTSYLTDQYSRIQSELAQARVIVEDWQDGCALRFWSIPTKPEILARTLRIEELRAILRHQKIS